MFEGEPISEDKLSRLRDSGIVAYSRFLTGSLILFAVLLSVLMIRDAGFEFVALCNAVLRRGWTPGLLAPDERSRLIAQMLLLFGVPLLAVFVTSMSVRLFQTRFLFRMGFASVQGKRLWNGEIFSLSRVAKNILIGLLLWAGLCILGLALLWLASSKAFLILRLSLAEYLAAPSHGLSHVGVYIALAMVLGAAFGWFTSRLAFAARHRMTREEIEREARGR